ncbi:DNA ligase 1 [Fundulus heteroclitus]|uniref:DNA ligase 1 n=1 Tax=Fundulus heteroclitus TaxID=8078 RepID=UPI00165B600C|nr:DNA ligase 1 [Fundulus heteroclitus]
MSVNATQLVLNQLIYRHLKEHGFVSAAEELQRHSPQGETGPSVSLLDIYNSWLKDPKRKGRNSSKCSKPGKGKSSAKAKSATPKKKTEKTVKNLSLPQSSPKKSVPVKRKKADEKAGQSVPKAKKSKLNTTETAAAAVGDGSDSDSSLDVEKWKKLLYQFTEADVAKLETIDALTAPEPKKKRVRKSRAKPLSKANTPVQQKGETVIQKEKGEEKAATQTPTKKNTAKKSPNKRAKSVEDTSMPPPEKPTQLQEMSVPVNAEDHKTDGTEVAPEPKKKKKKKEKEDKTEGKTNGDGTGNDRKQKRSEITEREDAKTENEVGKIGESNGTNENISELGLQKKKAKKKEKEKARSEENLAQTGEKTKKNTAGDKGNTEQLVGEINLPATEVGIDKNSEQSAQDKKAKKKKGKNNTEGNLEHVTAAEEANIQQNIIDEQHSEQIGQKKKKKKKEKTGNKENSTQIDEKKEEKKGMVNNEGNAEQTNDNVKANAEQIINTNELGDNEKSEQNVEGEKAKKRKEKKNVEGNLTIEQNVDDKENSEQMSEKKKKKKKKKESVGSEEAPEEVAREKKLKHKNEKSDKNELEQTVEEENPNDEGGVTENKSTLATSECSLETTTPAKKKKKKNESVGSEEVPEEVAREKKLKHKNEKSDKNDLERSVEEENPNDEGGCTENKSTLETSECSLETTTPAKKKKKKKNKLKTDKLPEEADISPQDVSATQTNSVDVHKKKKKSKSTES